MSYNTPKLNQETNDKWAQFDTLSDRLRGHCKHQTEESMTEYKKHIGQYEPSPYNDMMIDTPSPEELLSERNSAALGDAVQSFAIPRAAIKGDKPEPEAAERCAGELSSPMRTLSKRGYKHPCLRCKRWWTACPRASYSPTKIRCLQRLVTVKQS